MDPEEIEARRDGSFLWLTNYFLWLTSYFLWLTNFPFGIQKINKVKKNAIETNYGYFMCDQRGSGSSLQHGCQSLNLEHTNHVKRSYHGETSYAEFYKALGTEWGSECTVQNLGQLLRILIWGLVGVLVNIP